jgi:hypothetical protein
MKIIDVETEINSKIMQGRSVVNKPGKLVVESTKKVVVKLTA